MGLPECLKRDRNFFEQSCRASASATYMGDNVLLAKVLGGETLMYLDSTDRTIVPHICSSYWESWVSLCLARTVKPGDWCLDLGANHAYYSLLMRLAGGDTSRVLAVEPHPRLAALARWSMEVNGFQRECQVLEAAVSNVTGETATLSIDPHRGCNSTIVRAPRPQDSVITVPTVTVDAIVRDWDKLNVVKIDCEGAEELIWDGMARTLVAHPKLCIVMEVNTARAKDPEHFYQDIAKHFPLRAIDGEGMPRQVTVEELMTVHPETDWMLWLRRSGTL